MRSSVRNMINNCETCTQHRFKWTDTSHTWPSECTAWKRLHMDFGYHKLAGNMLIIVDSYSGWLEVMLCNNRTASVIINHLRSIFSRFGVPNVLVSDNAPEFTNRELQQWLDKIGCQLKHSPEYRPQSNGVAERMVGFMKSAIKCYNPSKCSINEYLDRLLFVHRVYLDQKYH